MLGGLNRCAAGRKIRRLPPDRHIKPIRNISLFSSRCGLRNGWCTGERDPIALMLEGIGRKGQHVRLLSRIDIVPLDLDADRPELPKRLREHGLIGAAFVGMAQRRECHQSRYLLLDGLLERKTTKALAGSDL